MHPDVRRQGVGKLLLLRLFEIADEIAREMNGGVALTLEVRISKLAAQRLYEGFGFRRAGIRRHYYSD